MQLNLLFPRFIKNIKIISSLIILSFTGTAQATIVQFETAFGNFEVNLYDQTTPQTVANFLTYINDGAYTNSIIHRSVPGFIIQGGGFTFNTWPTTSITPNAAVVNEPVLSNVRGTIAMAKLGNDPNSATNQWFFNLANNSANLDFQNDGFTVFGEVTGDGMAIIDQIAALDRFNFGGALTDLPLQNYSGSGNPEESNLVIISNISIIEAATDTAAGLNPPPTTNTGDDGDNGSDSSSGGGGSLFYLLALISLCGLNRRK